MKFMELRTYISQIYLDILLLFRSKSCQFGHSQTFTHFYDMEFIIVPIYLVSTEIWYISPCMLESSEINRREYPRNCFYFLLDLNDTTNNYSSQNCRKNFSIIQYIDIVIIQSSIAYHSLFFYCYQSRIFHHSFHYLFYSGHRNFAGFVIAQNMRYLFLIIYFMKKYLYIQN